MEHQRPPAGVLAWPVTSLWGPVAAYNVLVAVAIASSAWAVYLAVCRWVVHRAAAFVAGLAFAISPYLFGQTLGHLALIAVPLVPLTLLWVDSTVIRSQRSTRTGGVVLGLLLAGQFFISEEVFSSLLLMLLVGSIWILIFYPRAARAQLSRCARLAAWGAVPLVVLAGAPVLWQLLAPGAIHGPTMLPGQFSGRLLGFVVPSAAELLGNPGAYHLVEGDHYNLVEFGSYLGLPIMVVVTALALLRWRLSVVRLFVVMLCTSGILVLGANLHVSGGATGITLPGLVLAHIPVLEDLLPVRLSLCLDLFAVVLLAIAFDQAWQRGKLIWGVAAVVLALLSWAPAQLLLPVDNYPVPRYFSHAMVHPNQVLLVVPFAQSVSQAAAMEWQATSQLSFAMPDGYYTRTSAASGSFSHGPALDLLTWDLWTLEYGGYGPGPSVCRPMGFTPIARWLGPRNRAAVHAEPLINARLRSFTQHYLSEHQVNTVVLGPTAHRASLDHFLTELLGPSQRTKGVSLWSRPTGGWLSASSRS